MNNYFFTPSERQTTFMSSGARVVLVTRQELEIEERDGMSEITISEVYEQVTSASIEIAYYFSLPKDAVVTGI
jgi:hypothetical protein